MLLEGIKDLRRQLHVVSLRQTMGLGPTEGLRIGHTGTTTYLTLSECRACNVLVRHEHLGVGLTGHAWFCAIVVVSERE